MAVNQGSFVSMLPAGVRVSSKGRRLLAALLDFVLVVVTLGIGWIVWALIVHKDAATPGKQLLGMRVVKTDTGQATSWVYTFLREWIVKDTIVCVTFGVGAIWLLWDRHNQNLYDKLLGTIVVDDRQGLTLAANRSDQPVPV